MLACGVGNPIASASTITPSSGGISQDKAGVLAYDPNTSKWYTPQGG